MSQSVAIRLLAACLVSWCITIINSTATPADAATSKEEYQQWIKRYSNKWPDDRKMTIVAVLEDDVQRDPLNGHLDIRVCWISTGGTSSDCIISNGAVHGHDGKIPSADLQRIDELLRKLPQDGERLPPHGRRLLIQKKDGDGITSRLYDRANAPEPVLEILRIGNFRWFRPWTAEFASNNKIDAFRHGDGSCLRLSPDRSQILFADTNNSLRFWQSATHRHLGAIQIEFQHPENIAFSPDASLAVLSGSVWGKCVVVDAKQLCNSKTWNVFRRFEEPMIDRRQHGLSSPCFTPDGKYLVLHSSEPSLQIYDVSTWKRIARHPDIPEDTMQYFPATTKRLAVLRSKRGVASLWDLERHVAVAELDTGRRISQAVFSPDGSLVAVITYNENGSEDYRMNLWKTASGEFLHQLRPYEQAVDRSLRNVFWSSDGQYILAATSAANIGVWNVKSGRHRGDFVGCPFGIRGMAISNDGNELVVGNEDGVIRCWNYAAAMAELRDLEKSLEETKK